MNAIGWCSARLRSDGSDQSVRVPMAGHAFFLPRESRRASHWFFAAVGEGGRFALELPIAALAGRLNFALAATDDGSFYSDFSVPCFVGSG